MAGEELPSFDLVVATVDRVEQLRRLLDSLERQTHPRFRVLLVDQNDDDRVEEVLRDHSAIRVERLRSERGLSRARNVALARVDAELVGFPDDDCVYPDDLLERVARHFVVDPGLGGLTGRAMDADGHSSPSWARDPALLTRENLWNRAISFTIFLRASVVRSVGAFDEQLGLGAAAPWSSGEEIEYLVRALATEARIEYDPDMVVLHEHETRAVSAVGARDGASVGYILRKHRYPPGTVARMLVRPAGGAVLSTLRNDRARARFHVSTLRGRVVGYRGARA